VKYRTRRQQIVKAIAIAVLGSLAFGVTSYSFVAAQDITTSPTGNITTDNSTGLGNVTGANQTTTANVTGEVDTFFARGQVASVVSDALGGETNATGGNASALEILGGRWKVDVIGGEVLKVQVNMSMANPDGSNFHTHLLDNFTAGGTNETGTAGVNVTGGNQTGNETTATFPQQITGGNETGATGNETTAARINLSQDGTFEISGTANIYTGDRPHWQNVPVTIESTGRVLIINVDHEMTENHFKGQPIYGFVTGLIGEQNGVRISLLPSMEAGAPAPAGPALPSTPADNESEGNQTTPVPTTNQSGGASGGGTTEVSITPGSSSKTTDAYDPNPVEVSVGDTVTWINDDTQPHTVTSGSNGTPDGKFDSSPNLNPLMTSEQTFSHTFEEAGEYPYYCAVHPNMVGTVNVS
jgi:plastocyanin